MSENKKIIEKQYYAFKLRLASPLNVSAGLSEETDADVLRNGDGEVFIPGTSVAGAFRNALMLKEKSDGIMGYSDGEQGRMSSILISDIYFAEPEHVKTGIRDGIKLDDSKIVENKFDMEIVETGAVGTLYIECVVREGDTPEQYVDAIKKLVTMLQSGEIRFGANKNRGFGRVELLEEIDKEESKDVTDIGERTSKSMYVYSRIFAGKDIGAYKDFILACANINSKSDGSENCGHDTRLGLYDSQKLSDWIGEKWTEKCLNLNQHADADQPLDLEQYVKISVPLRLMGGISIRRYSAKSNQADFEHITCDGKPVIPGSSWNGAIRADVARILWELIDVGKDKQMIVENLIDGWFGKISDEQGESMQSLVVVSESIIEGATPVPMTRNKVNRFDASTVDGALYSEISYFGGKTTLELLIRKDEKRYYEELVEILQLVIRDIKEGFVAVGGQTAVGRGVFAPDGEQVDKTLGVPKLYELICSKEVGEA